ncbi:MAG: T9SS type A sorting domain-containing protein, partial [Ignavibacteria bacterium]
NIPASVLNNDTTYYWKILGQNSFGSGQWSTIWKFRTISFLPAAPSLVFPGNGAVNVTITPVLTWSSVPVATSYRVQVSRDSLFLDIVTNIGNITTLNYVVPLSVLSYGTKYYWRVNATNNNGTGSWSAIWNFSTVSPPAAPQLLSPPNGSDSVVLAPTLDWENVASANSYRVTVAVDSAFNNVILDIGNLTSSLYSIPSVYLTYSTRYYWKVNASNNIGAGPWSATWNFTTMNVPPPLPPVLIIPANNSSNVSLTPGLDWHNSSNAAYYRVNIATDLNFNNIVFDKDSIVLSSYSVPPNILNVNTLYFWRVNANNLGGTSNWSTTFAFRTIVTGINQIGTIIPDKYELYNNYPNPFNPVTKIRFDIPKSSTVRILLYDITGKAVMNLVDGELQAGSYETSVDATSLSSGLYLYRIETPDYSSTKRLMLIK